MIIETIVSTRSKDGALNFAPMGVRFEDDGRISFIVFHETTTFRNLRENPTGVANLTGDVSLFVATALTDGVPEHSMAEQAAGGVMAAADEAVEFTIEAMEDRGDRSRISGAVVARHRLNRPRAGFNRAQGAVIEGLIAVTRIGVLDDEEIAAALKRSRVIVDKTGGPTEKDAMDRIERHYDSRAG